MKFVRKFWLIGLKTNESIDLNNSKYFLHTPKNLGIEFKNDYLNIFNMQIKTNATYSFKDISAILKIDNYKSYEEFRKFLSNNIVSGFKFYYSPFDSVQRFVICDIVSLEKTEIEKYGCLNCPIKISPRTYWQDEITINNELISDSDIGKSYIRSELEDLFKYNYKYSSNANDGLFSHIYKYAGNIAGECKLTNIGDVETSLEITLFGEFINPSVGLYDVNYNLIQNADFNLEVRVKDRLVINSNPEKMQVNLISSENVVLDKTDTQNYLKTTYLTLPVGTYKLRVIELNNKFIKGTVKYKNQYIGA